jgi:hypothetical protein
MKFTALCGLLFLICINAFSSVGPERYRIVKDQSGKVIKILDISLGKGNDLLSFATQVRQNIKALTHGDPLQDKEVAGDLFKSDDLAKLESKFKKYQDKLAAQNIDAYFDDSRMDKILNHFEDQLGLIRAEKYQTVAHLQEKLFFTKEELFTRALRATKTLAKSLIDGGIFLNLVTYILDQYVANLMEAKAYHQHILLGWLTFERRDVFGLTVDEFRRARSSIMEARLNAWDLLSILSLKDDFPGFYESAIKKVRKKVRKRMRKNADRYTGRVEFLNDFQGRWTDKETGNKQIVNLYRKKSYFSSRPSLSYDQERPDFLRKKRRLYKIINLAQNLIPLPIIGSLMKNYNDKRFEKQIMEEGILYGQFEIDSDVTMLEVLRKQTLNPLIRLPEY